MDIGSSAAPTLVNTRTLSTEDQSNDSSYFLNNHLPDLFPCMIAFGTLDVMMTLTGTGYSAAITALEAGQRRGPESKGI